MKEGLYKHFLAAGPCSWRPGALVGGVSPDPWAGRAWLQGSVATNCSIFIHEYTYKYRYVHIYIYINKYVCMYVSM